MDDYNAEATLQPDTGIMLDDTQSMPLATPPSSLAPPPSTPSIGDISRQSLRSKFKTAAATTSSSASSEVDEGQLARIIAMATAGGGGGGGVTPHTHHTSSTASPSKPLQNRTNNRDETVTLRADEMNALAPIRESDVIATSSSSASSPSDDDSLDATPTTSARALRRRLRHAPVSAHSSTGSSSSSSDDTNSSLGGETPRDLTPPDDAQRFSAPRLLPTVTSRADSDLAQQQRKHDSRTANVRWQKAAVASRFSTRLKREITCTLVTPPCHGPDPFQTAIEVEMPPCEAPMIDGTLGKPILLPLPTHDKHVSCIA